MAIKMCSVQITIYLLLLLRYVTALLPLKLRIFMRQQFPDLWD